MKERTYIVDLIHARYEEEEDYNWIEVEERHIYFKKSEAIEMANRLIHIYDCDPNLSYPSYGYSGRYVNSYVVDSYAPLDKDWD